MDAFEVVKDEAGERAVIGRRNLLAGIGGLGLAGVIGINRVLAQEATPTATDDEDASDDPDAVVEDAFADAEREIGEAYQNFVAKLADQLGNTDAATVDTAIRNALKAMVDQEFDEGNISRNLATEIKERIDASEAPLMTAMLGAVAVRAGGRVHPGMPGAGFPGEIFPGEVEVIPGGPDRTVVFCGESVPAE